MGHYILNTRGKKEGSHSRDNDWEFSEIMMKSNHRSNNFREPQGTPFYQGGKKPKYVIFKELQCKDKEKCLKTEKKDTLYIEQS